MGKLKRKLRRGFAAFLSLCMFLTSFNMVSWADMTAAFSAKKATFVMDGNELKEAAQEAVDSGEVFRLEDLELPEEDSLPKQYERLLTKGALYEFYPSYEMKEEEEGVEGAQLRAFIRAPKSDGSGELTGEEEVIFLFINQSEEPVTFSLDVNGYKTKKVTVDSYDMAFGEPETEGKPSVIGGSAGGSGGSSSGGNNSSVTDSVIKPVVPEEGSVTDPDKKEEPQGTADQKNDAQNSEVTDTDTVEKPEDSSDGSGQGTAEEGKEQPDKDGQVENAGQTDDGSQKEDEGQPAENGGSENAGQADNQDGTDGSGQDDGSDQADNADHDQAENTDQDQAENTDQDQADTADQADDSDQTENEDPAGDAGQSEDENQAEEDASAGDSQEAQVSVSLNSVPVVMTAIEVNEDSDNMEQEDNTASEEQGTELETEKETENETPSAEVKETIIEINDEKDANAEEEEEILDGEELINDLDGDIEDDAEDTKGKVYDLIAFEETYTARAFVIKLGDLLKNAEETASSSNAVVVVEFLNTENNQKIKEDAVYDASNSSYQVGDEVEEESFAEEIAGFEFAFAGQEDLIGDEFLTLKASNLIRLYYAPAEVQAAYQLYLSHKLIAGDQEYIKMTAVDLNDQDFDADGNFNYSESMVEMEGVEAITGEPEMVINKSQFAESSYAEAGIEYGLLDGYGVREPEPSVQSRAFSLNAMDWPEVYQLDNLDAYITVNTEQGTSYWGTRTLKIVLSVDGEQYETSRNYRYDPGKTTVQLTDQAKESLAIGKMTLNQRTFTNGDKIEIERYGAKTLTITLVPYHTLTVRTSGPGETEVIYNGETTAIPKDEEKVISRVASGAPFTLNFKPEAGYGLALLKIAGKQVPLNEISSNNTYTAAEGISKNSEVEVYYAKVDAPDLEWKRSDSKDTKKGVKYYRNKYRNFTWDEMNSLKPAYSAWDKGSYFDTYVDGYDIPDHAFATWKYTGGDYGYDLRRFQTSFTIPEGYSADDYIRLKTVFQDNYTHLGDDGKIIPINDDIFVFVYKLGENVNNKNFQKYLAFWTGTQADSKFKGISPTESTHAKREVIPYTDGWYCEADLDNVGENLFKNYPNAKSGDTFILDVFVGDYAEGGGMDAMDLNFVKSGGYGVTINYYHDSISQSNYIDSEVLKGLGLGDIIVLSEYDGGYLLNAHKPDSTYTDGIQTPSSYKVTATSDGIINVVYTRQAKSVNVEYYTKESDGAAPQLVGTLSDQSFPLGMKYGEVVDLNKINDFISNADEYDEGVVLDADHVIDSSTTVIKAVFTKRKVGYTVNYYKDSVDPSNLVGSDTGSGTVGSVIPHTDGSYLPGGYTTPGEVSGQRIITERPDDNVLNVVYHKNTKLGYTVNYYKDSISTDNLLKSVPGTGTFGDPIPYTNGAYVPNGYKTPGEVSGQETITADPDQNVLNVVYERRNDIGYTVNYYKDSISQDNLIESESGEGTLGDRIPFTNGAHLPDGYKAPGEASGQFTITAEASENVVNVVYGKRTDLGYTVNYYKDSVDRNNLQGTVSGTGTLDAEIPYEDGKFLPDGYVTPGVVSGQETITADPSKNILNVVYNRNTEIGYTVKYYKDNTLKSNLLNTDNGTGTLGDLIPYEDGKYLPAGYVTPGNVSGQKYITAKAENNVLKVVYKKNTNLGYTVNYYKDSIDAKNLLKSDTGTGTFGELIPYSNGKYAPIGYLSTGQVTGQKEITEDPSKNVLNVVYDKKVKAPYKVIYYKDSIAIGNVLGVDCGWAEYGDPIPYTDGKYIERGYTTPGTVTGARYITLLPFGNVMFVVYHKNQNLKYVVNYYKDSVSTENKLGTESGVGTFGDPIPYSDGKFLPTGYVTPGLLDGKKLITEKEDENILNVIYHKNGQLGYTVIYYKDSALPANEVGRESGIGTFGDPIPYEDGNFLPKGYTTPGEVSGQESITVDSEANVLKVVYKKMTGLGYRVEYYKDSVQTDNFLGRDEGTGAYNDPILHDDGKYLPAGYVTPGDVSGAEKITEIQENNVKYVVYRKNTALKYTVNYYKDTIDQNHFLGSVSGTGTYMDPITYKDGEFLPDGYVTPGAASGQTTITEKEEENVLNVVYGKNTELEYQVNYYKDSISTENFIAREEGIGTFGDPIPYENGLHLPDGYTAPGEVVGQTTITSDPDNNIVNIIYSRNEHLGYTVNYYKDSIDPDNLLKSDTGEGTFGDDIPYTNGKYAPAGYKTEGVVSGQKYISEKTSDNVVNVVYEKDSFQYVVRYFYEDADKTVKENPSEAFGAEGVFGTVIPYNRDAQKMFEEKNYAFDRAEFGNPDGIVTEDPAVNYVHVYYAIDEKGGEEPKQPDGTPDKYQVTFTYQAEAHGQVTGRLEEVVTRALENGKFSETNPAYPSAAVTANPDSGYRVGNWTSDNPGWKNNQAVSSFGDTKAITEAGFTADTVFTAHFISQESGKVNYRVEFYYESEGKYPSTTQNVTVRQAKAGDQVSVTAADKAAKEGYILDTAAGNVENGTASEDSGLVLKLYFKQQFTVIYDPGAHGTFDKQVVTGLGYGSKTPAFGGNTTGSGRYYFAGWDPVVKDTVTESITYVAKWNYRSGGGSQAEAAEAALLSQEEAMAAIPAMVREL